VVRDLELTVNEAILEVVREKNPGVSEVRGGQQLNADLGLKSLDLARIVASLEMALEADPFAELVAITSIRTVGDLVGAYRRFFDKDSGAANQELEQGRSRAQNRQAAMAALKGRKERGGGGA
jgi:acyl carrier protein